MTGAESGAGGIGRHGRRVAPISGSGHRGRVSGGKKDDLQGAIALLRKQIELPLTFNNFRD